MPTPPLRQHNNAAPSFKLIAPNNKSGHRVCLYGTGGIGKSTLACCAPGPVAFIDNEESIGKLERQLLANGIDIPQLCPVGGFTEMRAALQSSVFDKSKTIVLDSATKTEDWNMANVLKFVKTDKGHVAHKIEDYGFGKGYQHMYESWLCLLGDFDRHVRAGRNIILIAHECVTEVPNPEGQDWKRYEPRLQSPSSGKGSIRHRTKEWSDHTLFFGYDVVVDEDGKGKGRGSRALYTAETPFCMAKSRTSGGETFAVNEIGFDWSQIFK